MSSTSLKSSPVAHNCFFRLSTWEHAMNFSRQIVFLYEIYRLRFCWISKKNQLDTFFEYGTDHLDYTFNKKYLFQAIRCNKRRRAETNFRIVSAYTRSGSTFTSIDTLIYNLTLYTICASTFKRIIGTKRNFFSVCV